MKILFTVMRFRKDGFATNVLELTEGLVHKGHEIHIITSGFHHDENTKKDTYFKKLQQDFENLGINIYYFNEPEGNIIKKGVIGLISTLKILYYITIINADVIHAQSPNTTIFPWLLGKKYISTVHTDIIRPNIGYKHPDILIAVSSGSKEFTKGVMGSPPNSIRIVHHGISQRFARKVNPEEITALTQANHIPSDKLIIGFVGRLIEAKGLDVIIDAAANHLRADIMEKIHFVFLGHYDDKEGQVWLENLIKTNHLESKITILPFQDPRPFYKIFDVFALPSRTDTFGLVAVEAMMSGCCTIRANSYGAVDQINNGVDGYIFDIDDSKELARLLQQVIEDAPLRAKIADAGRERALKDFTKDTMVENTIKVYEELMSM
jgi:glycosyltransferase involved in cell wall biosynthesis